MMVAEFIERQNSSPMNGETALHGSGPMNGSNSNPSNLHNSPSNNNNNNNNGPNGCNVNYCFIEPELGVMTRDVSNDSHGSEQDGQQYPSNYEMNHMQRKDLFSQRKQREFIPDNKKDESYWDRRRRNNEAAKRSREKRRYNDMILEQRVVELSKENHFLKAQLTAIKDKYGISGEAVVNVEQVMATLPTNDQVLSITKRAKMNNAPPPMLYPNNSVSVPIPTPVIHRTAVGPSPPLVPLHPAAVYPVESESYQQESSDRYPFPFTPVLPPLNPPVLEAAGNSVLNLSRSRSPAGPYELPLPLEQPSGASSLPHKLRHKSHLGDKDVAATALLSLHNIKQEPGSRASPPWDGEGSSDERDSGISLGAEWIMTPHNLTTEPHHSPSHDCIETEDDDATHIKSEVARLASEVASLKSLLSRKKASAIPTN